MKIIIAGTRRVPSGVTQDVLQEHVNAAVRALRERTGVEVTEIVSGNSGDVDLYGEKWAKFRGVPVKLFPADWDKHGKAAGPIRNRQMAQYADALVAVWDGKSRGTKNMIQAMDDLRKPVVAVTFSRAPTPVPQS